MPGCHSPRASTSSPPAETPNTSVRPAGSATPNRERTHRRTSPTKNFSCAANRSASKTGEYSWSRAVSSASPCTPTIIVDRMPAAEGGGGRLDGGVAAQPPGFPGRVVGAEEGPLAVEGDADRRGHRRAVLPVGGEQDGLRVP